MFKLAIKYKIDLQRLNWSISYMSLDVFGRLKARMKGGTRLSDGMKETCRMTALIANNGKSKPELCYCDYRSNIFIR